MEMVTVKNNETKNLLSKNSGNMGMRKICENKYIHMMKNMLVTMTSQRCIITQ